MSAIEYLNTRFDNYVQWTQTPAATSWDIQHNLDRLPKVTVWTGANEEIEPRIVHVNKNRCVIHFSVAYAGRAFVE